MQYNFILHLCLNCVQSLYHYLFFLFTIWSHCLLDVAIRKWKSSHFHFLFCFLNFFFSWSNLKAQTCSSSPCLGSQPLSGCLQCVFRCSNRRLTHSHRVTVVLIYIVQNFLTDVTFNPIHPWVKFHLTVLKYP